MCSISSMTRNNALLSLFCVLPIITTARYILHNILKPAPYYKLKKSSSVNRKMNHCAVVLVTTWCYYIYIYKYILKLLQLLLNRPYKLATSKLIEEMQLTGTSARTLFGSVRPANFAYSFAKRVQLWTQLEALKASVSYSQLRSNMLLDSQFCLYLYYYTYITEM